MRSFLPDFDLINLKLLLESWSDGLHMWTAQSRDMGDVKLWNWSFHHFMKVACVIVFVTWADFYFNLQILM